MDWESARRTSQTALIWVSLAALAVLLWVVREGLLLIFGAIVIAVLLHVLAAFISRWTHLSHGPSLAIATAFVIAVVGITFWRFGAQLSGQFSGLMHNVENGTRFLRELLQQHGFSSLSNQLAERGTSFITSFISDALKGGLRVIEAAIVLAIMGIYLAAQPALYRRGLALLFRPRQRERALNAIDLIGRTLKLWLFTQLILMLLVGILSFIALWIIGLPNPVALALIAGIFEFVPYLGPFISAIPALLVALTMGGLAPVIWTAIAYVGIHLFEGYLTAPLIERHFVTIPPALILSGIVICELLFGITGVVLAAPITVVVYMAVKMLYVEDPLEEHTAKADGGPHSR
ncbi:MAG TPA: AI-2E family transporter [Pseudolabrys sp.]|jgi:predicted PurR-regulated permease PerM|nr:AI-2E family transporter [Pseudolabrys sp.]